MGLRTVMGDVAVTSPLTSASTVVSGPIANAGTAADVVTFTQCSAVAGGTPGVVTSLEESDNGSSGWTAVPGSASASLAAAGSASSNGRATKNYVRTSSVVTGAGTNSFRVLVLIIPE